MSSGEETMSLSQVAAKIGGENAEGIDSRMHPLNVVNVIESDLRDVGELENVEKLLALELAHNKKLYRSQCHVILKQLKRWPKFCFEGGLYMGRFLMLAVAVALLSGCVSFNVPTYSPTSQNLDVIGNRPAKFNIALSTPAFEDTGKILCRGAGDVTIQQDKRYTDYISEALENELKVQGLLDEKNDKTVFIKFTKLDFSSSLGATNWFIDAEYSFNGNTQTISTVVNFDSNYFGNVACNNMALNFPKAVAQHLFQFYTSPIFQTVAGAKTLSRNPETPNVRLDNLRKALQDGLISEEEFTAKRNQIIRDF